MHHGLTLLTFETQFRFEVGAAISPKSCTNINEPNPNQVDVTMRPRKKQQTAALQKESH